MEQRQLYFRTYNVQTRQYDRDLLPSANVDEHGHFYFLSAPDEFITEQWTGEVDTNNRKIFENDVLQRKENPGNIFRVVMSDAGWELHSTDEEVIIPLAPVDGYVVVATVHDDINIWKL